MPTENFSSFWNRITQTKILDNKDSRPKIMGHDKSHHIKSENFRKSVWFSEKLKSLEHPLRKKISKFLGNLPSEQIFYRNVPLGAPILEPLIFLY